MAELFQAKPQNITMHLKNVIANGELAELAICKGFLQVQMVGVKLFGLLAAIKLCPAILFSLFNAEINA